MKGLILFALLVATILCADYVILLKERVSFSDTSFLNAMDFDTRGQAVYSALVNTAESTQKPIRSILRNLGYEFHPYWIANMIIVRNADSKLLQVLGNRGDIESIQELPPVIFDLETPSAGNFNGTPDWNVQLVKAPDAWKKGATGKGVVTGIVDSGVHYKHKALYQKYRGRTEGHAYNWMDYTSSRACKSEPCDTHGHGSHVTGIIVGSDESRVVGMAPEAQFISCRPDLSFNAVPWANCLQWMAAPTDLDGKNPQPSKRPHVINNSWGFFQKVQAFDDAAKALNAAGVFVIFAAGNEGSKCSSLRHPGQNEEIFTVGATSYQSTTIVGFSSRGPAFTHKNAKPNIVAPGDRIMSCSRSGDGYVQMSGTSMATPTVVGGVAVMLSKKPHLKGNINEIRKVMEQSADVKESRECSSISNHPNNVYGWGFMNLDKATN